MKRGWTREEMLENTYQYEELSKYDKEKADFIKNTLNQLIKELTAYVDEVCYIRKNMKANEDEQEEEYVYYFNTFSQIYGRVNISYDSHVDIILDVIKYIFKR